MPVYMCPFCHKIFVDVVVRGKVYSLNCPRCGNEIPEQATFSNMSSNRLFRVLNAARNKSSNIVIGGSTGIALKGSAKVIARTLLKSSSSVALNRTLGRLLKKGFGNG
jgi:hypothetical protein